MRESDRKGAKLREASWKDALDLLAKRLKKAGASVAAIAGDLLDAETMYAAKKLLEGRGSSLLEGRQTGLAYDISSLAAVAFNSTIPGIETSDTVLQNPLGLYLVSFDWTQTATNP